jgi:hypothetical protein
VGLYATLTSVACIIAADTGAYFVGKNLGRTKLTEISPKKTVEGALGGLASAIAVALLFWQLCRWPESWAAAAGYGVSTASRAAQLGAADRCSTECNSCVRTATARCQGRVLLLHACMLFFAPCHVCASCRAVGDRVCLLPLTHAFAGAVLLYSGGDLLLQYIRGPY